MTPYKTILDLSQWRSQDWQVVGARTRIQWFSSATEAFLVPLYNHWNPPSNKTTQYTVSRGSKLVTTSGKDLHYSGKVEAVQNQLQRFLMSRSLWIDVEFAAVGAAIGGGLDNKSEFIPFKFKEVMTRLIKTNGWYQSNKNTNLWYKTVYWKQ